VTQTELQPLPPSRRELNKAATRDAIAASALALLRARGMGEFTVDDVADAAGVSRRTFFNYFSSAEAAIASYTQSYLDNVLAELLARPAEEPLLESAQQALIAVADPRHLASIAETFTLTHDHPQLSRFQLEAWDNCSTKIIAAVTDRLGGSVDELYLHALVGSVLSCGKAALEIWFSRHGGDMSPASLAKLRSLLIDSIGLLQHGFAR